MNPPIQLLTARQVSEVLAVSIPMVYKLIHQGEIEVVRLGSALRVHPEDLTAFIVSHRSRKKPA